MDLAPSAIAGSRCATPERSSSCSSSPSSTCVGTFAASFPSADRAYAAVSSRTAGTGSACTASSRTAGTGSACTASFTPRAHRD